MNQVGELVKKIMGADGLEKLGQEFADLLCKNTPFTVWLQGSLGAGKTTLVKHILQAMGLPSHIPVTSPTYTFMNEYHIEGKWYAHLDLYRSSPDQDLDDFGVWDAKPYQGIFIEWPEQVESSPDLAPTHKVSIQDHGWDQRAYIFEEVER